MAVLTRRLATEAGARANLTGVSKALPRWQATLFLVGALFVGTPDGVEIINLTASVLLAIAIGPYGIKIVVGASRST